MKEIIKFITYYILGWLLVCVASRAIFLLYNLSKTQTLNLEEIANTFLYGLKLDTSIIAYILLPMMAILLINQLISFKIIAKLFTYLALFLVTFLVFVDIELYQAWNFRIDNTFFVYLKNLKEMSASVSSSPVFLLVTLFCCAYFYFIYLFKIIFNYFPAKSTEIWHKKVLNGLMLLIITLSLIIPIRGGLQQIPINQSAVYFSTKQFANHAAVNPIWNFFDSIVLQKDITSNPYLYLSESEAKSQVDSLYAGNELFTKIIKPEITKPNVILIVWESLSSKVVGSVGGLGVTPNFDALSKEGILFTNAYASGDRTDKGIVAVLSAFPAQPIASIVQEPKKAERLPILSRDFKHQNYHTSFYYGGELGFAGMQSYLKTGEFGRLITKNDFRKAECNSKWGAYDHIVFQKMANDLKSEPEPFFSTILTLTSHEPFEIPRDWAKHPIYGNSNDESSKFANVHFYSDAAFGQFITEIKKQSYWNNTLIVVVGDHGARLIDTHNNFDNYKTPILFLGGALSQSGIVQNQIVSQLDIAKTVLEQCNLNGKDYQWSRNLFGNSKQHFSFTAFKNGFVYNNGNKQMLFDNIGKNVAEQKGEIDDKFLKQGKALQQMTFEDYLHPNK